MSETESPNKFMTAGRDEWFRWSFCHFD